MRKAERMRRISYISRVQSLRDRGFDDSTYLGNGKWRVSCSQCDALVINGVATHETGCPNIPKESDDDDDT